MDVLRFTKIAWHMVDITTKGRRLNDMSRENKKAFGRFLKEKMEHLGPTFVKFGQMLSVRFDLLPSEVCMELQHLLDNSMPFDTEIARQIIEREIGIPIPQVFPEFDDKPVAAASIGQVYRAKLKSGEEVAIKVRRPSVDENIKRDIKLFKKVIKLATVIKFARMLRFRDIFSEFERWTIGELDYMVELKNIEKFNFTYKDTDDFRVPVPYRQYSTSKVLVMEYIEGTTIEEIMRAKEKVTGDVVNIRKQEFNVKEIINKLFGVLILENLETGLYHGDPHPANILVDKEDNICFVDFGIAGNLSKHMVQKVKDVVNAIVSGDIKQIVDVAVSIDENLGNEQADRLRKELSEFVVSVSGSSMDELSFTSFFAQLLYVGSRNGIEWPMDLVLLAKQFITLDGIAIKLCPEMDPFNEIVPYMKKLAMKDFAEKFSDSNLVKAFQKYFEAGMKAPELALKMISSAETILDKIEKGDNILLEGESRGAEGLSQNTFLVMFVGFLIMMTLFSIVILSMLDVENVISLRLLWIIAIILVGLIFTLIVKK